VQRSFALLLVFVSFTLSSLFSRTIFERLPHLEDEVAYLFQARVFARGDIAAPAPDPSRPFWQPFIITQDGKRFSKYTPGWSLFLAVGVSMGTPWVVNALMGAGTVALTYRLGEEIFSPDVGLIATFLLTFSPMALLLNASLMSHTAALFCVMLAIYGYWRSTRGRWNIVWGIVAGAALGGLAITRSLTALAVATPFVIDALIRLGWSIPQRQLGKTLRPLLALSIAAAVFVPIVPLYRYLTTGDPTTNTYLLVWDYDRVGFGPDVGRSGHTLERGLRTMRRDLSLTASDLFGWQFIPLSGEQRIHLLTQSDRYPGTGWSWVLLPFGVIVGLMNRQRRWAVLLIALPLAIITAHLAYWIGSQRYSTRYYYEGIAAAALISALPLAVLCRSATRRFFVYGLLILVTTYTFIVYTQPRLNLLQGFNTISRALLEDVYERRTTDRHILVLLSGDDTTWRAGGSLLVVTSPYLDSEIVLARNMDGGRYLQSIYEMFPDREIISMQGEGSSETFVDGPP
jgi:hypothetical protein